MGFFLCFLLGGPPGLTVLQPLVQLFWHLRNLLFKTETVSNKATFTKLTLDFTFDNGCSYANKNLSEDDREMWQLCFHREAALLPHAAQTN